MFNSNINNCNDGSIYKPIPPEIDNVDNINDLYKYIKSEFDRINTRLDKLEAGQKQELDNIEYARNDLKSTVKSWS